MRARLSLSLTTWNAKIQVNLTTTALPEARGRILTALSRMPGTGVDLLKGSSAFDKISEQFMSLYHVLFHLCYAEILIDNQRSNKCIPEFTRLWGPIFNTLANPVLLWVMPFFIRAHLRVPVFSLFLFLYSEF